MKSTACTTLKRARATVERRQLFLGPIDFKRYFETISKGTRRQVIHGVGVYVTKNTKYMLKVQQ